MAETGAIIYPEVAHLHPQSHLQSQPQPQGEAPLVNATPARSNAISPPTTATSPTLRIVNRTPPPPEYTTSNPHPNSNLTSRVNPPVFNPQPNTNNPTTNQPTNEDAIPPLRIYQSRGIMNRDRRSYSPLLGSSSSPTSISATEPFARTDLSGRTAGSGPLGPRTGNAPLGRGDPVRREASARFFPNSNQNQSVSDVQRRQGSGLGTGSVNYYDGSEDFYE